jgi:alpha/beta superfamily hydrolase
MSKSLQTEKLFVDGPVGRLEAILEMPGSGQLSGCAVVCHPHPQHGGTMHNKVAHTLAREFVAEGLLTLRFNFRGTEASDGEFDNGVGELDDALAAIAWVREKFPAGPIWLAGFSFGAAIAVRAAIATEVAGLISVAPAISRFANGLKDQPRCPWLVVLGDEDELVDLNDTIDWLNGLEEGPELLVVPGGEHFFHGKLAIVREAVRDFVAEH